MATDIEISATATLAEIEAAISRLQHADKISRGFTARIASERRSTYFKDIWAAMAVAAAIRGRANSRVTAWGLKDWSKQDDEDGFALSYPSITALQLWRGS